MESAGTDMGQNGADRILGADGAGNAPAAPGDGDQQHYEYFGKA